MQDIVQQFSVTRIDQVAPALGQIVVFVGDNIPNGWLPCDGRMLRRFGYSQLFRVIGTRYGDGDGSNTAFNLPTLESLKPDTCYLIFVGIPDAH